MQCQEYLQCWDSRAGQIELPNCHFGPVITEGTSTTDSQLVGVEGMEVVGMEVVVVVVVEVEVVGMEVVVEVEVVGMEVVVEVVTLPVLCTHRCLV